MKKTLPLLFIALLGCNNGSSIANDPGSGGTTSATTSASTGGMTPSNTGGSATGGVTASATGGVTASATGGVTASATGGVTASATGGTAAAATGGNIATATGGITAAATGGTTATATGGSTGTASGGTVATGGTKEATGGTVSTGGTSATATGGITSSGGNSDAGAPDTKKPDASPGTGGVASTGGVAATGGTTGAGGSTGACVPAASGGPSGMKSGQACMSCHSGSGASGGVNMKVAGTLYSTVTGSAAVSGATITITPANGTPIKLVTGSSGNFYTTSTVTFPATVQVSKCPDTATMPMTITSGDCNSCHNATNRIHLP